MAASRRGFVLRHTRLGPVPGLDGLRLHLADEVLPVWRAVQVETKDADAPVPAEHPEIVAGRRVFDLASGSGLCAIAAMQAGATRATSADVDAFAVAAIPLNARANGCRINVVHRDVLDEEPPDADIVLAGDVWYDPRLAERVLPWLHRAREQGIDVLVGDPGRRYLPTAELVELASYDIRTTTDLEDLDHKQGRVYALRPAR